MSTQVEFVVQFKSAALHCKCAVLVSLHFFPNKILIFVKQFKITRVVMSILLLNIVKYTFLQEGSGFESSGLALCGVHMFLLWLWRFSPGIPGSPQARSMNVGLTGN